MSDMHGPFEVDLKIRMTDGNQTAVVTYTLPVGQYPTKESVQKGMEESLKQVREQMNSEDWNFLNRPDFENEVLGERTGGIMGRGNNRFATKDDWDEAPDLYPMPMA